MFYTKCSHKGERINGRIEGRGKFTFANGNTYVGNFRDGLFHGKGTVFFTAKNGGGKYKALWEDGVAVDETGTYFFRDGLQYRGDWEYCTTKDRRCWEEHNTFIIPPVSEANGIKRTIIPDYNQGPPAAHLADLEADEVADVEDVNYETTPIPGNPHHLRFADVPVSEPIKAGRPFTVAVEVHDFYNNLVQSCSQPISLQLGESDGDGELSVKENPMTPSHSKCIFEVTFTEPGCFSLVATAGRLKAASCIPLEAAPQTPRPTNPATSIRLRGLPQSIVDGQEFSLTAQLLDEQGGLVTGGNDEITIELTEESGGTLSGSLCQRAQNGSVLFHDLCFGTSGGKQAAPGEWDYFSIRATGDGICSPDSHPVRVERDVEIQPEQLVFVGVPDRPPRGVPFSVRVALFDMEGRISPLARKKVGLELGVGKGTFKATSPVESEGGHALFEDVVYFGSDPFTLTATSEEGIQGTTTGRPSQCLPSPFALHILRIEPMQISPDSPFSVIVELQDAVNDKITTDREMDVRLEIATGGGSVITDQVNLDGGLITFTDVYYTGPADSFTLRAQGEIADGEGDARSLRESLPSRSVEIGDKNLMAPIVDSGSPNQIVMTCLPTDPPLIGGPFTLVVEVQDALGRLCHDASNWVTLDLIEGTGDLRGTYPKRAMGGQVWFTDLEYSGDDVYTVRASSQGLLPCVTADLLPASDRSVRSSTHTASPFPSPR